MVAANPIRRAPPDIASQRIALHAAEIAARQKPRFASQDELQTASAFVTLSNRIRWISWSQAVSFPFAFTFSVPKNYYRRALVIANANPRSALGTTLVFWWGSDTVQNTGFIAVELAKAYKEESVNISTDAIMLSCNITPAAGGQALVLEGIDL